jgi:hypothetical protein
VVVHDQPPSAALLVDEGETRGIADRLAVQLQDARIESLVDCDIAEHLHAVLSDADRRIAQRGDILEIVGYQHRLVAQHGEEMPKRKASGAYSATMSRELLCG